MSYNPRRYPRTCACCGVDFLAAAPGGRYCSRRCAAKCISHVGDRRRIKPELERCRVRVTAWVPVLPELRPEVGSVYEAERLPGLDRDHPHPNYAIRIGGKRLLLRPDEVQEI